MQGKAECVSSCQTQGRHSGPQNIIHADSRVQGLRDYKVPDGADSHPENLAGTTGSSREHSTSLEGLHAHAGTDTQ